MQNKKFQKNADEIVSATLINIYTLSKESNQIVLSGLDIENEEHLFVLHVAMATRDVSHLPLYVKGEWKLKFWLKKNYPSIKWTNKLKPTVEIPVILEYERPLLNEKLKDKNFGDIYKEFYETEKKKK